MKEIPKRNSNAYNAILNALYSITATVYYLWTSELVTIAIVWKLHVAYSVRSFRVFRGNLLSPPSTLHMGVGSFL
jgi:hypothetical protein